jgi:hypothetical protein
MKHCYKMKELALMAAATALAACILALTASVIAGAV